MSLILFSLTLFAIVKNIVVNSNATDSNIKNIDGVNQVIMLFTSEWGSLYGVSFRNR